MSGLHIYQYLEQRTLNYLKVTRLLMVTISFLSALVLSLSLLSLWLLDRHYPLPKSGSISTVVLADNGEVLRAFSNADQQWRYPIDMDDVPENYLDLLLGYEDRWFYQHIGINPFAIMRAAWQNLVEQRIVSGGSTLTMQVSRLLAPHERTVSGKMQQMLRALQLEWHLTKQQILNLYLNLAPFGGTLIGVQAASVSYFDKPLSQISDAEAALLAVLPQAPSRWRPDRHPKLAKKARDKVLKRMLALSIWPQERVVDALQEPIFSLQYEAPLIAPLLARRLKKSCPECEKIPSFIDIQMQRQLESLVKDYVARLPDALSVALLVMENKTGAVRTYIGSADFLDNQRFGHVDMAKATRSPGSTLKPFLYALAIDSGIVHSQSLLQDTPRFNEAYQPLNFSGGFNGPVSVTQALQRSLNIPAVQVLEQLGPAYFAAKLESAGLKLKGPGGLKPNVSMILGGVGTQLESLVGIYSALARSGIAIKPRLQKQQPRVERFLLSPGAAWIGWRMLAVNPSRSSKNQRISGHWPLAWKTGTSYGYREAWAMGVSKQWTIGVWVGRPDGSASPGISGRKTAAPLLFKAFKGIDSGQGLAKPNSVNKALICWPLGQKSAKNALLSRHSKGHCQQQKTAWLLNDTAPRTLANEQLLKRVWYNQINQRVNPNCTSAQQSSTTIALWPIALEPWVEKNQRRAALLGNISEQCRQFIVAVNKISINSVADNSVYKYQQGGLSLRLSAQGGSGKQFWYLNGRYLTQSSALLPGVLKILELGGYQLSVVDEHGNSDLVTFDVE